ncbi:winged helix-turn-helix domain-containing protein [Escherichia coli]
MPPVTGAPSGVTCTVLTARSEEVDRLLGWKLALTTMWLTRFHPAKCAPGAHLTASGEEVLVAVSRHPYWSFELNERAAQISWFDTPLTLTRYEFLLLKTLLESPGRVWSRQQLMDSVWEDAQTPADRTVDTHIKTCACRAARHQSRILSPINTHRGMGYSLRGL